MKTEILLNYLIQNTDSEHRVKAKDLIKFTGIKDSRTIRQVRRKLQREGKHVVSSLTGFYYEPDVNKWILAMTEDLLAKLSDEAETIRIAKMKAQKENNLNLILE